jgi:hypothetical protein
MSVLSKDITSQVYLIYHKDGSEAGYTSHFCEETDQEIRLASNTSRRH